MTPVHGTALDIVGRGVASTGALESAIRLAASLSVADKQRTLAGEGPSPRARMAS